MHPYQLQHRFFLRTPLLPLDGPLARLLSQPTASGQTELLYRLYEDPLLREALFLASPVLHQQLEKQLSDKKLSAEEQEQLTVSLTRYLLRMSTRPTPFGLFAGCTLGQWDVENQIRLSPPGQHGRHTRPDMDYLCQLAQNLSRQTGIREQLLYFPNTSYYVFGDTIRFVDYHYQNQRRSHRLAASEYSEYIEQVIERCKRGATGTAIAETLSGEDISLSEALEFVDELIEGKLLVSELDGNTTGPEMLNRMIGILERMNGSDVAQVKARQLVQLLQALDNIDAKRPAAPGNPYQAVFDILEQLEHAYEPNRLLQVDMARPASVCRLDAAIAQSIQKGLAVLNRLSPRGQDGPLERFKKAFTDRYETKEVSLLEVMDVESGLGYGNAGPGDINPLIDDLPARNPDSGAVLPWNKHTALLLRLLQKARETGAYELRLTDADLQDLAEPNWNDIVDSFSVLFKVHPNPEDATAAPQVYINIVNGPSNRLLGRFTHLNPEIDAFVRQIADEENANHPDAILAEVAHLPESRLGNVLLRTHIRDYDIPYLAHSTLPPENQIPLQDMTVRVEDNEIILYSKTLNKRVIPVMSNAHNYTSNGLPVYQFLCDLQYQGKRSGMQFGWGVLAQEAKFLPRVSYENLIFSRASWQLSAGDLKPLHNLKRDEDVVAKVHAWKNQWNIPDRALVVRGDHELFVDFNNHLCVQSFLHEVKNKGGVTIAEFLFDSTGGGMVRDNAGHSYAHEIVAVFTKKPAATQIRPPAARLEQPRIKRSFPIGSEWLYFKLYCGVKTADAILAQHIRPLTDLLQHRSWVDHWFFLRYNDPNAHLRLRLRLNDARALGPVLQAAHEILAQPLADRLLWKIQTDTYEREIERYGAANMEFTEFLFHVDSEHTLRFLEQLPQFPDDHRWFYGLLAADELLDAFGLGLPEKLRFTEYMKAAFETEFRVKESQAFKKQLNGKFRDQRQHLIPLLNRSGEYGDLYALLAKRRADIYPAAQAIMGSCQKNGDSAEAYLSSYIHMLFNRLFTSNQRMYELTLYALLHGFYQQQYHTAKNKHLVSN